jgi:ABC-2 type transport system ATP-binding protein
VASASLAIPLIRKEARAAVDRSPVLRREGRGRNTVTRFAPVHPAAIAAAARRPALVEVENLTKVYGDIPAIQNVTFEARAGEILGFLGKNGAGKTTTMRVMTGFMSPTSGTVRIDGFDIREDSLEARARIGYLPESAPLYEDMSVSSYLTFCARIRQVPPKEIAERVQSVMKAVNIQERRNWQIGKLSKGLRRRVGLAQALVHNPKVLILDEPTEGLDPQQIIEIRRLILGLRGGHTVILSTHILPEAQALADRIVIIDTGRIVAVDTTENLTAAVQSVQRLRVQVNGPAAAVRERLAALAGVQRVQPLDGDPPRFVVESDLATDLRDRVAAEIVHAGWGLLELERLEPTLEDVFLHITGRKYDAGDDEAGSEAGREADPDGKHEDHEDQEDQKKVVTV